MTISRSRRCRSRAMLAAALLAGVADVIAGLPASARPAPVVGARHTPRSDALAAWRSGAIDDAVRAADAAVAAQGGADALLVKAELSDAQGRVAVAADGYRQALAATPEASRDPIALRLAMIGVMRGPQSLLDYARLQLPAVADRVALVLALLGRPGDALALDRGGDANVADALRLAGWAIAAGQQRVAEGHAARAVAQARDDETRRYALALLIEAYRDARDLAGALSALSALPQDADVTAARVDMLLELGRNDEAIAIMERSTDPSLRRRLIGVLDLSGRDADGIREYRRLIAAHPDQPQWYGALAAQYLAHGDEAQALAVYRELFAANRGRDEVRIAAARQMIAMGMRAQAEALLGTGDGSPASAQAIGLFLFESAADQGDDARARQVLESLRRSATDPALLAEVADGYDRLGQPAEALAILHELEARGVPFGYDRQMRLAEIAAAAGNRDEALARWRRLWTTATLPARRSYIERQIAALARQTGQLDGLAREMEGRLDAGRLRPSEIDLLVALRIAQEDQDAAVADVTRYAARRGVDEVATQEQLATLYARVHDYDGFGRALRRLTVIDPAHRDTHLRQLILNTLRSSEGSAPGPARRAELDRLIGELDRGGEASSRQFKAAVYQMASLDDQALSELRADADARPDDGDALLQLTGALKKRQRIAEAAALLQYAAVHARTSAAFATAIDGLIDLLADAPADGAGAISPGAGLQWAERKVLERIVSAGEDARLLGLLSDIGQARGDYGLQIRALDASLPTAGDQRASVLRELVTLNGGSGGGDGAGGPAIGDPRLKIVYGRRLIALRKSYPPDFYGDLGRTLLARNDVPGAERAFAMMDEADGLVNVDEVKGDAYAAQGYTAAALADYGRALLRDQDNLDLIVKTSILRERLGQYALARRWYWRGLRDLVLRQPAVSADGQDDIRVDVRRHSATLVEGLVSTWSSDPADARAITDELRRLFDDVVTRIDPAHPGTFAIHPRLALIVETGRRLGDIGADGGMSGEWSARLDRLFAGDPDYRRDVARRRDLVGISAGGAAPSTGDADWPITALRAQAADFDNVLLQLALAIRTQDWDMAHAIADRALARETEWRGEVARTGRADGLPPVYLQVVQELVARLPADRVRPMVLAPLDASPFRDEILFDLFRGAPDDYAKLETIAGKPLLSNDRLFDLTVKRGNSALGLSARAARHRVPPDAWMARFSNDQLVSLYDRLVEQMVRGAGDSSLDAVLATRLLAAPLDPAEQARLAATMQRDVGFVRDTARPSVGPLLPLLLQLDAAPGNRAVAMQAARSAADRYPDAGSLPALLGAWYAGDRPAAYRAMRALGPAVAARYRDGQSVESLIGDRFAAERRAEAEAFLAAPDAARSADFYTRFVTGVQDGVPTDQLVRYYRTLLRVEPTNRAYRAGLLGTLAQMGQYDAFAATLRDYVDAHPEDQDAATTLAFAWLLAGKPADATAVARAANVDIADPDWIVQILNRARAASSGGIIALFPNIYQAYAEHAPQAPVVAAVRARGGGGAADPGAGDDTARRLAEAARRDPASVPGLLRALWRDSAAPSGDGGDDDRRDALAQALVSAGTDLATAAILLGAGATGELEHDLSIMDPDKRIAEQPLYDLVAHGLIAQGRGGDRLRAAGALPPGGDAHALAVATALANRQPTLIDPATRDAIVTMARTMPIASFAGRIALARVMAASGRQSEATGLLRAAVLQMLYPQAPPDSADDAPAQIVAALDLWPDRQAARVMHAELSREIGEAKRGVGPAIALPPLDAAATDTRK